MQAHSLKYLKQQKRFEQKKYEQFITHTFVVEIGSNTFSCRIRNLRRLWNENVFYTNKMAAFARIRSQGISIKKLLWKFYKYNEMEKIHILSLHAVLERYFVDIEIRNAEFVVKRLVINEKLDQLIRSVVSYFVLIREWEMLRENDFIKKLIAPL